MNKDVFSIRSGEAGVVHLAGRLDAAQADKARAFLETFHGPLVLDLGDLDYISSAGLSVLLVTLKRLEAGGHSMRLRQVRDRILNVFRYAGLDNIFSIE